MDFEIPEELISGNNEDDAEYVAQHLLEALRVAGKVGVGDEIRICKMPEGEAN